jgi:transposase InsO family protein
MMDSSLHHIISDCATATAAWNKIHDSFSTLGPIHQVSLLKHALSTRFTPGINIDVTLLALEHTMKDMFAAGPIKEDDWMIMICLNALSHDFFTPIHKQLEGILTSTKDGISFDGLKARLRFEASKVRHANQAIAAEEAMAAVSVKKPRVTCTNCNKLGHTKEKCWRPGGGDEGGGPRACAKKEKEREATLAAADANVVGETKTESANIANAKWPISAMAAPSYPISFYRPDDHLYESDWSFACIDKLEPTCSIDWLAHRHSMRSSELALASMESVPHFLDSGASIHCTQCKDDFVKITSITPRPIKGMNGSVAEAIGVGDVTMRTLSGQSLTLRKVLYVPDATIRLISVGKLGDDDNYVSVFSRDQCRVYDQAKQEILRGTRACGGLYFVPTASSAHAYANLARAPASLETWHKRLGHVNYPSIIAMAKKGMATGMPTDLSSMPPVCEHCILGKQAKTPVPKICEGKRAEGTLDVVFSDITGPEDVPAGGKFYALNFIDDHSRQTWTYLLAKKSDALNAFTEWQTLVERQSGCTVKKFITDNGREYTSKLYEKYLLSHGIQHLLTAPYSSAENGVVERSHRTLMSRERSIRSDANLPPSLWGECILTAVYLKNRMPTKALEDKTPYEVWTGHKPDLSHLREIGCRAFILIQNRHVAKIYNRSVKCVLVG